MDAKIFKRNAEKQGLWCDDLPKEDLLLALRWIREVDLLEFNSAFELVWFQLQPRIFWML